MNDNRAFLLGLAAATGVYCTVTAALVFLLGHRFEPFLFAKAWWAVRAHPPASMYAIYGAGIAVGVLIVVLLAERRPRTHGDAHWASAHEIRRMGLFAKKGLILCRSRGRIVRTDKPLSAIMMAPPDTGKSALFFVPNLLSWSESAIIFDVKGALYALTSKFRGSFSKVVKFDVLSPDCPRFNPLASNMLPDGWDDIVAEVEVLATIIYPTPGREAEAHWAIGARIVFIFCALDLIRVHGSTSIPDVRKHALALQAYVDERDEKDGGGGKGMQAWLARYLDELEDRLPERLVEEASDLFGRASREFGSVFSTFSTGLTAWADRRIARAFSGESEFKPEDYRRERLSVYVLVKDKDCRRFATALRVFFEVLASVLLSEERLPKDNMVFYALDEFVRLGKMDIIMQAPALQRSYGIVTLFGAQSDSQIERIYGRDYLNEIRNTTAYKIYLTQNGESDCEAVSRACGTRTIRKESRTYGRPANISEGERRLILPQEVGSLKFGECIVSAQGFKETPIRGKGLPFYRIGALKKRVGCIEAGFASKAFDESSSDEAAERASNVVPIARPDPEPQDDPPVTISAILGALDDPESVEGDVCNEDADSEPDFSDIDLEGLDEAIEALGEADES